MKQIINNVKKNRDEALYYYNKVFDKFDLKNFIVNNDKILESSKYIKKNLKQAILIAFNNIKKFHTAQKFNNISMKIKKGLYCQQISRPISSVGLYIPGGSVPLFSTVLMLAIPAILAECKEIIICSPPPISNKILYAAKICNIKKIFQIGGAHAIAAMVFGTKTIPKVDKIFGPGNTWVTEAKRQINYRLDGVAIDMLAGPSELLIIADELANPKFIAADLLSQAEHGPESQIMLITNSMKLAKIVSHEIEKQIKILDRYLIIKKSLLNSRIIITNDLKESIYISNHYSPEHLMINTKNSRNLLSEINNAGSIFIGNFSPESAGDYVSGTNHVLPTYGL